MLISQGEIDRLKRAFELQDWDIAVIEDKTIDACGECDLYYRSAVIRVNPTAIQDCIDKGHPTSEMETIVHEFAEIIMQERLDLLPNRVTDSNAFDQFRDHIAERMRRIVRHDAV